jgi:hypothetical protein
VVFESVVFSSYEIEERAPYRGETIARLGALLEAARPRHRGGVGGREGVGGYEKSRSRVPIRLPASPVEQGISHAGSSRVHEVVQRIYGYLLRSPVSERRSDAQGRQHHLLAAPDRP